MEQEHEEILRLVFESETESREIAFGSDNKVFIKTTENGLTEGWKQAGRWESFDKLEMRAFECYNSGWIVAWNEKYKPKGWKCDG